MAEFVTKGRNAQFGDLLFWKGGSDFSPANIPDLVAWYDPSDLSTMYQDAAMTMPVTTAGDPVGAIMDKSGQGNHLTQPTAAARPTYQTDGALHWLQFDGVDDGLFSAAPFPFSEDIFSALAFRVAAWNASFPEVVSHRGSGVSSDTRQPFVFVSQSSGNIGSNIAQNSSYPIPGGALGADVVTSMWASGLDRNYNNNGNESTNSAGPILTGAGTEPYRISGGNRFNGRFYGALLRKSPDGRGSPFPGQTYATASVTGMPSAV